MTKRKPLSRLARVRIYDAHGGVCCLCGQPINASGGGKWIVEHMKPLWLGGADDETNMAPAHWRCAIDKTTKEAPVKAKTDRMRAKQIGVRKPRTMTRWRRFNGDLVIAPRER